MGGCFKHSSMNKGGTASFRPFRGRKPFYFIGNLVSCEIETLRGMRTRAAQKFVAKATALGARVPHAELFVLIMEECGSAAGMEQFWLSCLVKPCAARHESLL